jgi:hypothetical protein
LTTIHQRPTDRRHFTLPRHIFLILGQTVFAVINVINAVYLEENKEIPILKPLVQPVWGTKLIMTEIVAFLKE